MFYISWFKVRNVSFTPEHNKMAEGGDDLTNCPVCFDEYTETGDHIPKILPCSHSLCEKCLEVLIRNNKIDCPECRVKHEATSRTRTFPQNKYIVTHLQKRQRSELDSHKLLFGGQLDKCLQHNTEKSLYCKEDKCKKAVCPICFARHHRNHKSVDLETQRAECDPLFKEIEAFKENLVERREKMLSSRNKVEKRNADCIAAILNRKEQVLKDVNEKFSALKKEAEDVTENTLKSINADISVMDEYCTALDSIKEGINMNTNESDIARTSATVQGIIDEWEDLKDVEPKLIAYNEGNITAENLEKVCGRLNYLVIDASESDTKAESIIPEQQIFSSDDKKHMTASDNTLTGIRKFHNRQIPKLISSQIQDILCQLT